MSDVTICVDNLGKHYRLGSGPAGRGDFREAVGGMLRRLRQRPTDDDGARDLWALRDVSFEVRRGETVGLIGHNGAGKSTLLKILSRITDPTEGHAWFDGRVGSLLEVGTGFHPELTGRENVYLNGAILGMNRNEVKRRFDEIVEFSEIGRFLDTPVKRYSSGMYVRLAFAVAAHLEPEVLIVDEVLAVGDAQFQSKCMGKMRDVADAGRTILFVSHNMASIQQLCDRAVVLQNGRKIGEGDPDDAIKLYLKANTQAVAKDLAKREDRAGRGDTRFVQAIGSHRSATRTPSTSSSTAAPPVSPSASRRASRRWRASSPSGTTAATPSAASRAGRWQIIDERNEPGDRTFVCDVADLPLSPGEYHVTASLFSGPVLEDRVRSILTFRVEFGRQDGRAFDADQKDVTFVPPHRWIVPPDAA